METLDPADFIDDVCVVIVAAGSGARLGAKRPKAFVGLGGQVLLAHSLLAFEEHEAVDAIVVVVPDGWEGPADMLVADLGCDKVTSIVVGGATRAHSVVEGLSGVPDRRATAVLVHDAARPVVPAALVDRVLAPLAEGYDAVVPTLEVTDTVKRVSADGVVVETLDRGALRRIQTPQACRASSLHAALRGLDDEGLAAVTDDAAAIERWGGKVLAVPGDTRAEKVTDARDLERLEATSFTRSASRDVGADMEDERDEPLGDDDLAGLDPEEVAT